MVVYIGEHMVVRHGGRAEEDGGVGNDATRLDKVHSHPESTAVIGSCESDLRH